MPRLQPLYRTAMLSFVIATAACSAQPAEPGPDVLHYDGTYRGTQTTLATGPDCPESARPVQFRVSGGHVWNHRRSRHHRMDGNVDGAGRVTMQDESGRHQLSGSIRNGRLVASETTAPRRSRMSPLQSDEALSCLSRVEAERSAAAEAAPEQ